MHSSPTWNDKKPRVKAQSNPPPPKKNNFRQGKAWKMLSGHTVTFNEIMRMDASWKEFQDMLVLHIKRKN